MRYHNEPIRMAKIQNIDHTKCLQGCRTIGTLLYYWWECKMAQSFWKIVWEVFKNKCILTYCTVQQLCSLTTSKGAEKLCLHLNLHEIFTATLFIVAKTWKKLRCPSSGKWTKCSNKLFTMKYWLVLKKICDQDKNRYREP